MLIVVFSFFVKIYYQDLVSTLLEFVPLRKFDRFRVLSFFVKTLSMLLLYMKVLIYMCTSFLLK